VRNEYKVTYEASPVSEIPKLVFIKANNISNAIQMFFNRFDKETPVFKVELTDEDVK
jgi:hypothetical protein